MYVCIYVFFMCIIIVPYNNYAGNEALGDVINYLTDVFPRYCEIGKMLGLQSDILEEMKKKRFESTAAMIDIIEHWLAQDYDVPRYGKPTWKSLVMAVANKNGGNNVAVAMKLTDMHTSKRYISMYNYRVSVWKKWLLHIGRPVKGTGYIELIIA